VDIWAWVYRTQEELEQSGNERLAQLMNDIPPAVLADENDEVEAMVPEALSLARSLSLPWVEIYLRHWHLQARGGGFDVVPDAVELLEFSHREEHKACPQSVCTVQDLTIAYGGADGPGFAEERLAASAETLERIDPSWPCFACISAQHVGALNDAGRHEEALAYADRSLAISSGDDEERVTDAAEALIALGRPEEALERLRAAHRRDTRDSVFARSRRLYMAEALLVLGRPAEAREEQLPYEIALREPAYARRWTLIAAGLADAGELENDWRAGSGIERLLDRLLERGRAWDAVRVAAIHGRLALARSARETAEHALATGRAQAERLRDPSRGAAELAELERALAREPDDTQHALPDTPAALLEELRALDEPDAEQVGERLAAAARRWPDEHEIALARAGALDAMGRPGAAWRVLSAYAERHPDDADAWASAGVAAVEARDADAVERAEERLESASPVHAAWLRGRWAVERGEYREAAAIAARTLEFEPEAKGLRRLWLHAAEELGDWRAAREQVDALLPHAEEDETEGLRWSLLMAATALADWETVRATAAAVGMELPEGEGPVDVEVAAVRLWFSPREVLPAVRTGPVTARVIAIARDGEQRAGAVALFDPYPLEDSDDQPLLFRVREVLEPSAVEAWPFDAVDPGEEAWLGLRDALHAEGWLVNSFRYPEEHDLPGDRHGIYGMIAVPRPADTRAVHERLGELAAELPEPLFWPVLAEAAGDAGAAARQRERASELGLLPD
jgi:tetratricopeptide (TPR) repeat protein